MLKRFKIIPLIIMVLCFTFLGDSLRVLGDTQEKTDVIEERYSTVYSTWRNEGVKVSDDFYSKIYSEEFTVSNNESILDKENSRGYGKKVVELKKDQSIKFQIESKEEGLYELSVDYFPLSNGLVPIQGQIKVNDEFQYFEARRFVFPVLWENESLDFKFDRNGNEVMPLQKQVETWLNTSFRDSSYREPENLKIKLKAGINTIEILGSSGEVLIGDITISAPIKYDTYEEYRNGLENKNKKTGVLIIQEGEKNKYKNNTASGAYSSRDIAVSPYDTNKLLLNTFNSKKSGQTVYYEIEVEESGLYNLSFKIKQDSKTNAKVYRTITIDNKIPFVEAKSFAFNSTKKWQTVSFGNENGNFEIFLEKGTHLIGLEADASTHNDIITTLSEVMSDVNDLSLEIKKIIGNNDDPYRDWDITDYIPGIEKDLIAMADNIEKELQLSIEKNGSEDVEEFNKLKIAINKLRELASDPNKLPNKLGQLSEGSGSVSQMLGDVIALLESQPLMLDQIYLYSDDMKLPEYSTSILKKVSEGIKRFAHSFVSKQKVEAKEDEVVLNIWVNRARSYVDILQKIADEEFTSTTGIKVNFSVMPNEQKLVLANSAGTQPDIALGLSTTIPYEFAIRNSALDLTQFEDFKNIIGNFSSGALISYMMEDGVYGLPETQDFYVTFYRKDILSKLGIPVPDTWNEVIEILPELQRYGMNYYTPLALSAGSKPFMFTAPFIYQNGGDIYNQESMEVDLNSEEALNGIKLMTDIFSIYGLPLQVPNFYNHFRYGTLPIGIGNMENYLKLKNAAPELEGSWALAPHPGIEGEDGVVKRWATGSAQSSMIFKDTKNKEEAWEFLKWWLSTDTQVNFAYQLQNIYGPEYVWSTANLEAFKQLPIDEEDKNAILEQWKWLIEVPKLPGGYMVERELSNVWSKIVFNDENPRAAIDNAVITMNRELKRKLEEFGYMKDGKIIKQYRIPTIEKLESWGE